MARTSLTIQTTSRTGLSPSYVSGDAANGHDFNNAGQNVVIHIKNGSGSTVTLTVVTPGTVDGLAVANRDIAIPAGEERIVGPFRKDQYGTGNNQDTVQLDLDDDTSVTLAALKLGSI